jgi:acetyl esterase/lipase
MIGSPFSRYHSAGGREQTREKEDIDCFKLGASGSLCTLIAISQVQTMAMFVTNDPLVLVFVVLMLADGNVTKPSLRGRLVYSALLLRKSFSREKTLEERRRELDRVGKLMGRFVNVDVEPVMAGGVSAEWVCPPGSLDEHAIVYLHGGAYTIGSLESHRGKAGRIARASGICALVVGYRLAPEHPYPAAVEDATAAYHWLLETGLSSENIVIAGDSAGGGLTMATLLSLRDAGDPTPAAAVLLSPWTDLAGTGDSITRLAAVDPC